MGTARLKTMRRVVCLLSPWLWAGILLAPLLAQAEKADLEQVVSEIQATYEGIQDLSARFHQVSWIKSSGTKEESSGSLLMKKPGMMRWEYKSPESRSIVSDGKSLYIYSPRDRQVIVQETSKAFSSLAVDLLTGMGRLKTDFQIQWGKAEEKGRKGSLLLELRPIQAQGQVQLVLIEVHPETFVVERIVLKDAYSNTTVLTLKRVKTNTGLQDHLFAFVPPPGTEIIKGFPGLKKQ
jgi:outer membrane lipoprotein carrier protein